MVFKNEFVPPLEQETSEFFKKAREILRTGHTNYDQWTVDREREMVLFRRGGGHSTEAQNEDYWSFLTANRQYHIDTELLQKSTTSPEIIKISLQISFRGDPDEHPDMETLAHIKEALREHSKWQLFNPEAFKSSEINLIDGRTGKEV